MKIKDIIKEFCEKQKKLYDSDAESFEEEKKIIMEYLNYLDKEVVIEK